MHAYWRKLRNGCDGTTWLPAGTQTPEPEKVPNPDGRSTNCFGFPNIGNSCFMNSCLQTFLSLQDFMSDISCQEDLWGSVPGAQLLRRFTDIRDCRESEDYSVKLGHQCTFKNTFATYAPDYNDEEEKDAHKFLTLLLDQFQTMSPELQMTAALLGQSYTCPVEGHFVFHMENVRTCKSCGAETSHQKFISRPRCGRLHYGHVRGFPAGKRVGV